MARFLAGIVAGVILGTTASAYAVSIIGSGRLFGWEVVYEDSVLCDNPYVRPTREIEC